MSYLLNDAATFTAEMTEGFVAAHADLVRPVEGGVVRAAATPPGQVAVVIGGGSGHYPAFAGLVGTGLAHGAAMGNVFASPSAHQVYSVARAAASDAGVLLTYGNYAGDVLNFDQAQQRLNDEGIATRTVVVTDDVSSAPSAERERRRGVAGDLTVFRAAAWAAEQGRPLDAVTEFAQRANARTRTLGVAFSGCTLPGADGPLFTVAPGRMAIGMGIHGEPGLSEQPLGTADEIADLLVDRVLADRPEVDERHVAVLVNGLGSVKSEELFVLYRGVASRLDAAGLVPVRPEVGEFATSFEMAGVSLTVTWLDDELEQAWCAPAVAPGYRRGEVAPAGEPSPAVIPMHAAVPASGSDRTDRPVGTASSRDAAERVLAVLRAVRATVDEHADELGRLDSVAGDGDHGIGMQRGARAAVEAAEAAFAESAGAQTLLREAADAWADRAGGTSGALWGVGLNAIAATWDDETPVTGQRVAQGVQAAATAVARAGRVEVGDKTMVDALVPFAERLTAGLEAGDGLARAWAAAADEATARAAASAALTPRAGRARTHADKSNGTPDPGAVSLALAVTAAAHALAERAGAVT